MASTARALVLEAEARFVAADLHFGHGTDNARDEAVFLVFHALGLPFDCDEAALDVALPVGRVAAAERLVQARINTRRPAAYLTQRMRFAGHEFFVDERVLIPRSPIAELIADDFQPWRGAIPVARILDIGTGSGCIAIAAALAYPTAQVDATDISSAALAVAARNVAHYQLSARVHLHAADLYPPAPPAPKRYDLIIANPPYVPASERKDLPPEYLHEPAVALFADEDGLALVRRILVNAAEYLNPAGLLVMDTGGSWPTVDREFASLPFTWVELAHGGDGICVLRRPDLEKFARAAPGSR
ncbi:MAG: 50S ribosomal protein L3 N(5)-glutamine methyltransferase [Gammaproteobacteria bacterium]|nr:50S ribosomal protein L3 N(5)-glutamine methyltransferase [Gammaproteobacteria bacterium]